ncbi:MULTISPECIES: hypothetical protein [Acidihalobacter]|uniref:Uncharacterized protein n=1 Tax=Acidihalobacter yilgarnensis TaxID=2819280 RepID=A0A1D8IP84_9GAMM|nr:MULTISPECIES: hypothetical protein [Acidihalobacter]AOU98261.1 hypothetical protein BI364_10080 [Acidihalobacter yilgarnensis]
MSDELDYESRVSERKRNRIPLSETDDENLEHTLFFTVFLTPEQQAEVRGTDDYLEKRRLIVRYSEEFAESDD